jgi:hypothetical protein
LLTQYPLAQALGALRFYVNTSSTIDFQTILTLILTNWVVFTRDPDGAHFSLRSFGERTTNSTMSYGT